MTPDRWARIKEIFSAAFERPEAERSAFLDAACDGDAALRVEVERLLRGGDGDSLRSPASGILTAGAEPAPGDMVAHYRVEARLGEGGMGVVYRATDTRLGRSVALKFVKAQFGSRSQREARAVAALNHPNVCTLHDVGSNYLVMELIEGPTMAERMAKGPIAMKEALGIARQIAEALEAAHEKGIVHRDLKPANIKLTADGTVKVLDFGLARIQEPAAGNPEDSPTLTVTEAGMILGTAAYMSPEQAGGSAVDKRADIWSFGVVLWEMLTGRRLFAGETVTHTLASVLRGPIEFEQLPRETPAAIRGLLRRCLDRDVRRRLRDIGEARIAIDGALDGEAPSMKRAPARPSWLAWSIAALAIAGFAMLALLHFREMPPPSVAPVSFQFLPPEGKTGRNPVLSPDGRKVAFNAGGRLWIHSLETGQSRDIMPSVEFVPFWSPDSRFIGFASQGKLKKIEVDGSPAQTVTDLPNGFGGGAWNQDGVIIFGSGNIFRVSASGGVPVPVTAFGSAQQGGQQVGPTFLPDGRHFFYMSRSIAVKNAGVYLGSFDARPEQQSSTPLVASNWQPGYAPSADPGMGYLLFVRNSTLMAQHFDCRRFALQGQAVAIVDQIKDDLNGLGGWGAFSVSTNNVLIFRQAPLADGRLTWFDRDGNTLNTVGEPGDYRVLALSPDGTQLAATRRTGQTGNLWMVDLSRGGASTRFTFGSANDRNPVWSPDGSSIIFDSDRGGDHYNLYRKPVSGSSDEELLLESAEHKEPTSWSHHGKFLLYQASNPKTKGDIWLLPVQGSGKPFPFQVTESYELQARFSADGRWVAYASLESGKYEVYVRPFRLNTDETGVESGGKHQISSQGGIEPRWRGDGRELYYHAPRGGVMAVDITTDPTLRAGKPHPLGLSFPLKYTSGDIMWDVTADGQRFLRQVAPGGAEPFTVMLNWQAGLKK